jgi:hypothetical protein
MKIHFAFTNRNLVLFTLLAVLSLGCVPRETRDSRVQQFVDSFFKEKFFEQIDEERQEYEGMVKKLKEKGLEKASIKKAYEETRIAYNAVLDLMIADINATRNIAGFATFDADSRYNYDLERARKKGKSFYAGASDELDEEEYMSSAAAISFVMLKLYPLLKQVHDRSLDYCKRRMDSRIQQSKFRSWSDI